MIFSISNISCKWSIWLDFKNTCETDLKKLTGTEQMRWHVCNQGVFTELNREIRID